MNLLTILGLLAIVGVAGGIYYFVKRGNAVSKVTDTTTKLLGDAEAAVSDLLKKK